MMSPEGLFFYRFLYASMKRYIAVDRTDYWRMIDL